MHYIVQSDLAGTRLFWQASKIMTHHRKYPPGKIKYNGGDLSYLSSAIFILSGTSGGCSIHLFLIIMLNQLLESAKFFIIILSYAETISVLITVARPVP